MLKQPVGFVKLTNVALIRHRVKGRRFEVACYPNKVLDWRNGLEKDVAEVLQSGEIFSNVEQGELARVSDLRDCFGALSRDQIIHVILEKGELQVSQKEREALSESIYNEVLKIVCERVVFSENKRLIPLEQVKAALKEINFHPNINRPAKKQAGECVRLLEESFKIERKAFLVRVVGSPELFSELAQALPVEAVQPCEMATLYVVGSKSFPKLEAFVKERKGQMQVVDNEHYNKQPRVFGEAEVFLQRNDRKSCPAIVPDPVEHKVVPPPIEGQAPSCSTCGGATFASKPAYREHLKSAWHNFNLSAKLKGQPPLSEEKHEEIRLMMEISGQKDAKGRRR